MQHNVGIMKVKVLSRNPDNYLRETKKDIHKSKYCGTLIMEAQGLETYFNMHKYTELLTYLTKIRISEYKYIQGIELHGGQFAYRPRSNRDFSQSF